MVDTKLPSGEDLLSSSDDELWSTFTPDRVKRAAVSRGHARVTPFSFQGHLVQVRKKRTVIQTDRET